jgi:hypothetical protein
MEMLVKRTEDFEVDGLGAAGQWSSAAWHDLSRVGKGRSTHATRAKLLYSRRGLYFLVECQDRRLTCTMTRDFDNLFMEDVVEIFIQTDPGHPVYLEYEISPLGFELPILVSNSQGKFHGWLPWNYRDGRVIRHATSAAGGPKQPGAEVESWTAEFCIPYALLNGMGNLPPHSGTRWKANLYRIDYDDEPISQWAWCTDTGGEFHNYWQFGTLVFE